MTYFRAVSVAWLVAVFFSAWPVTPVIAGELDYAAAINVAGRQRMLTQRITKSYLQIELGTNTELSREQLQASVALFERQLLKLQRFTSTQEVSMALSRIETLWQPFREKALATPSLVDAAELNRAGEVLLQACEDVVQLLEDASGSEFGRLVNISGRQRMLSQRLAKYYMLYAANVETRAAREQMLRAANEFKGGLDTLISAVENTPAISNKLEAVARQWMWLDSAIGMQDGTVYPLIVADASEKILLLMESITDMYARNARLH